MEEIKRKRGRPVGSKNRPKNAPLTYETTKTDGEVVLAEVPPSDAHITIHTPIKIILDENENYDTGTRGHVGDGNFRPRIEDASAGTRNTDVEEPNATGISVSANTVVTSIPTLNPQSKLEKFVNWFLQKWDKCRNL